MSDDPRQQEQIASAWREAVARDAQEAPPPALDAKIRAASRVAAVPAAVKRRSYLAPLALAASVVIAVGLGLRQRPIDPPEPSPAAPAVTMPQETKQSTPPAALSAQPERRAPSPADTTMKEEARSARDTMSSAPAQALQENEAASQREPGSIIRGAAAPPPARAAEAPAALARARRSEAAGETAAAAAAVEVETDTTFAAIRALLARGERDAAAALARDYLKREPPPPPLPADLRALIETPP